MAPSSPVRRIAMLIYDGVNAVDAAGPLEVFSTASMLASLRDGPTSRYECVTLGAHSGSVRTGSGLRIEPDRSYRDWRGAIDTLLVAGGDARSVARDEALQRWLRRMAPRVRRIGSVCTGAFILAKAGLLDGRRATTHWGSADELAARFPEVEVDADSIFVVDDPVYTSAGVTAGMDLALAMVEDDHDPALAMDVARTLVMFLRRPGGQNQFSAHLAAQQPDATMWTEVTGWIIDHLDQDLSVERLASRAAMSPRNFARVFAREVGLTPAKYVERARVERARLYLEQGDLPIETIADRCGFGSGERMRRTFLRHLAVVPHDYRRRFEAR